MEFRHVNGVALFILGHELVAVRPCFASTQKLAQPLQQSGNLLRARERSPHEDGHRRWRTVSAVKTLTQSNKTNHY